MGLVTSLLYIADSKPPLIGTGLEQSSLTGNSYPDRSIGNKSGGGDQSSSSHLERDATLGAGAVGISTHRHEHPQRDNYVPETSRSFLLGSGSASSPNLANKADLRVESDVSRTMDNSGDGSISGGYGSGTGVKSSSGNQGSIGCDALGAGAGAGAGTVVSGTTPGTGYASEPWQHEHQPHGNPYEGDPCKIVEVGDRGGPHFVSGPHVTDTANRLDPHVGGGIGGPGITGNSSGHHHHGHHDHRGEEAALAGGAGTAGLETLEPDRGKQTGTGKTTSSGLELLNTDHRGLDATGGM